MMRSALAFLTPLGRARTPDAGTADWFPYAGAVIGLALGGLWWAAGRLWTGLVAAGVVVVADLALTGMLHVDGLADTADGLLPHLALERRLEVMEAADVGAFGVSAVAGALLLRWAALASMRPGVLLLGGLWALSRAAMAVVVRTQPYARPGGGLASAFRGPASWAVLAVGAALAAGMILAWRLGPGAAVIGAAAAAAMVVTWFARRRIGGYTGDVLGALGVVAETAGLLVAAARW
jgi:adenosylcobinamide-GDP ribazoletransferase